VLDFVLRLEVDKGCRLRPHVVLILVNFKAASTSVNASFLSENYYMALALLQIHLQACVAQVSKNILDVGLVVLQICNVIQVFGKWYGQAASTSSPPGDRHVWLVSSMRVPLYVCLFPKQLLLVNGGQGAGNAESARLLPKAHVTDPDGSRKALVIASNFLPKETPRSMNLFSIEVVSIVLDLGDQISTSTAKYPELRISMSPDSA
ncbi:hypothetical protein NEUTE1DRAFT_35831, partial [Neurospora tetrasperma FGSC 2508]